MTPASSDESNLKPTSGRLERELEVAREQRDEARRHLRQLERSVAYRLGKKAERAFRVVRGIRRRARLLTRGTARTDRGQAVRGDEYNRPAPLRALPDQRPKPRVPHPDVTIVIPVYNSAQWIDDCLSSVLAQTAVDLEVICVNDGSTDMSLAILQKFAAEDTRVTVIEQTNQGQSAGRNVGLSIATGRYLVFLDSDDFWPQDTLAQLVKQADTQNLDVLMFNCQAFLDGVVAESTWKRYSTYYERSRRYQEVRTGAAMIADMRRHRDYRPHVGMYLARTTLVQEKGVRFIPGIIHQDNPYTFELLLNAERVAHTNAEIYARRIRPGSTITTLQDARSVVGYFRSYVAMTRVIQGREFASDITEMLAEVVYGVFDGASKKVAALTTEELAEVRAIDAGFDAQLAFRALTEFRS